VAAGRGGTLDGETAAIPAKEKAVLWINHDKAQRDTLKLSPAYYD